MESTRAQMEGQPSSQPASLPQQPSQSGTKHHSGIFMQPGLHATLPMETPNAAHSVSTYGAGLKAPEGSLYPTFLPKTTPSRAVKCSVGPVWRHGTVPVCVHAAEQDTSA